MKLENNSLKYGMNSANNANSAFSNAYNQEMANQRDMQGQVTQRQKTLLEAAVQEANYKQNERNALYGMNTRDGKTHWMGADANYDQEVNTILENNTQPFRMIRDSTEQSLPVWRDIDINGNIEDARQSTLPFNAVSQGVIYHPTNVAAAKALGMSPEEYVRRKYALYAPQKGI